MYIIYSFNLIAMIMIIIHMRYKIEMKYISQSRII